jgi:NADH-quinone oxidoreductase subunit F
VSPITSSIAYFRDEYLLHFQKGGCPFDPMASTVFGEAGTQRTSVDEAAGVGA